MVDINPFSLIPQGGLLYFNYGLAFIFLGVVIVSKNMKGSRLRIAVPLKYLALFGFTHGTLEWSELFLLFQGPLMTQPQILFIKSLGLLFGISSFFFLIFFGFSLMRRITHRKYVKFISGLTITIFIAWLALVVQQLVMYRNDYLLFLQQVESVSRYGLAFTGSSFAALALFVYSSKVKKKSEVTAENFLRASIAFFLYGIVAGLVSSKIAVPAIDVPIEFFRLLAAGSITLFIVKGLNIFDMETRQTVSDQTMQLVQAEKLASLGRLAAGVAHEINNPLTNASLNVQMVNRILVERKEENDALLNKVDAISRNIARASVIARELLQFSRNDSEVFSSVDINAVAQHALDTLDYKYDNIKITKKFDTLPLISGSYGKLQQVLINILHNSLEAMDGQGRLEIATSVIEGSVNVTISDSGVGIPQQKLEKLFDPFFTTKEIGQGTGLGLFICYGIIHQHNGRINIKSSVGLGTTVTIQLPIDQEEYEKDTHRR